MGYKFKCADVGLKCDFETTAESTAEVIKQATAHAMQAHRAEALTLASKVKSEIKPE